MLELQDVTVAYGQHRALEAASLKVRPGEIVVILGANGAGKSTLLKAVSGICEGKVGGSIKLDGEELIDLPADRIVEEGIALVPEGRGIFGDLTVEENLMLGSYPKRAKGQEQANLERVYGLFPKLIERRRQVVRTMSGGEQQMVAIGRAMMSSPQILTLDEPSLGLSPLLCKELFQNLHAVKQLGIGILMVEQNAKQSLAIADRGYLLENAHIVFEDTAQALIHDPAVQAAYLGAGGAASPHTHDDPAEHSNTEAAPAPEVPRSFAVRPPSRQRQSADALLGIRTSDLVARASAAAKPPPVAARAAARPASAGSDADRLRAVIDEIERAAETARQRRAAPAQFHRHRPGGPETEHE